MNKSSNVPPGPSLKGGKNRTRRGGGIFSNTAKVAPNIPKKYPAENQLKSERANLDAKVVEKIRQIKPSTTNNSRVRLEAEIEVLQKRIDKINELLGETVNNNVNINALLDEENNSSENASNENSEINEHLAKINRVNNALARPLTNKLSPNVQAELNALLKGGKRKSGRTRGSRKRKSSRTRRSRK
jgi:predicted  nucleic acid-binding Zn-ribbon protein